MVGAAMGLAARGAIPFPVDVRRVLHARGRLHPHGGDRRHQRQAGRLACRRVDRRRRPVADGARRLRDVRRRSPTSSALYPSDAVSTERLVAEAAAMHGPVYIRTSRPKTPVIYGNDEQFPIGGLKVVRKSAKDTATVIGAGITLFEAIKAHDELKAKGISIRVIDLYSVQPIDAAALIEAGKETGRLITVEDHYVAGGLGDAVARAVAPAGLTVTRLAVPEIPRSGKPEELVDKFGISRAPHRQCRHGTAERERPVRMRFVLRFNALAIAAALSRWRCRPRSRASRRRRAGTRVGAGRQAHRRVVSRSHLDDDAGGQAGEGRDRRRDGEHDRARAGVVARRHPPGLRRRSRRRLRHLRRRAEERRRRRRAGGRDDDGG